MPSRKIRKCLPTGAALSCAALLVACGASQGSAKLKAPEAQPSWRFVSEWEPILMLAMGGGNLWALTGEGLMRTTVDEPGGWTRIAGLFPEGENPPVRVLEATGSGALWVGGAGMLASIEPGKATRATAIEERLGTITAIAHTGDGRVWVAGGLKAAFREGESWKVMELPFRTGRAAAAGTTLWLGAGEQGIARIEGSDVSELPDPVGVRDAEIAEGDPAPGKPAIMVRSRPALSLASRRDKLWVLWGGDDAYLSTLDGDAWHAYSLPEGVGNVLGIAGAGSELYVQTARGIFLLVDGAGEGSHALVPLGDPIEPRAFTYTVDPIDASSDVEPPLKSGKGKAPPVEGLPPASPGVGHKYVLPALSLEQVAVDTWSPVTAMAGDGDTLALGTETMGTRIVKKGKPAGEIAAYEAEPRLPMSGYLAPDGDFFYVLAADSRAGAVRDGDFSALQVTGDEYEKLIAFDEEGGKGYAMSLVPEFETVQFFEYREGECVKVLERAVDIASGIGDVGGFVARPDGSFWFTVITATEGLEMGAAMVNPAYAGIVYHGSQPTPEYGAVIPNGVTRIVLAPDGTVWLGGMEGAVHLDKDLEPSIYREPEGLVGDMVTDMVVDGEGKIWAQTVDGIGWFGDGAWRFPTEYPYRGTIISCLGVDGSGNVVIVDDEAVRRKNGDDWEIVVLREDLPGRDILDVATGAKGRLWIVTDRAIAIAPKL